MVSGLIGGVIAVIICSFISKRISHKSKNGALKYGLLIHGIAWACLLIALFACYALVFDKFDQTNQSELYSLICLIIGFGICSIYSFGEAFYTFGRFDKDSIQFHTPWTGIKNEKWVNLVSVEFNQTANWYLLTFKSGAKIRISNLLNGYGLLLDHLKSLEFEF